MFWWKYYSSVTHNVIKSQVRKSLNSLQRVSSPTLQQKQTNKKIIQVHPLLDINNVVFSCQNREISISKIMPLCKNNQGEWNFAFGTESIKKRDISGTGTFLSRNNIPVWEAWLKFYCIRLPADASGTHSVT